MQLSQMLVVATSSVQPSMCSDGLGPPAGASYTVESWNEQYGKGGRKEGDLDPEVGWGWGLVAVVTTKSDPFFWP